MPVVALTVATCAGPPFDLGAAVEGAASTALLVNGSYSGIVELASVTYVRDRDGGEEG